MVTLTVAGINRPALVDDEFAGLSIYRWRLDRDGYVMRKSAGRRIYLHQVVMGVPPESGLVPDHVHRDKLDNRRGELRWLTRAENTHNRSPAKGNRTGFRGVRFDKAAGRYLARVQHKGRALVREWFDDPAEADRFLRSVRPTLLSAAVD